MKSFKSAATKHLESDGGYSQDVIYLMSQSSSKKAKNKTVDKLGSEEVITAVRKSCHPEKIQDERRHSSDHTL